MRARIVAAVATSLILVPIAGFELLRLTGVADRSARLFALETLTPWLVVPTLVVLVAAVASRVPVVIGASVAVCVPLAVWVAPDLG